MLTHAGKIPTGPHKPLQICTEQLEIYTVYFLYSGFTVHIEMYTLEIYTYQCILSIRWHEVTEPQVVSKAQFSDHYDLSSSSQILVCKDLNSQTSDEGIIRDPIYWH